MLSQFPKRFVIAIASLALVVGMSPTVSLASVTGDIDFRKHKPVSADGAAQVESIQSAATVKGGAAEATQSGNFSLSSGDVVNSTLNAAGAVNLFSQQPVVRSRQDGTFNVITGSIEGNSGNRSKVNAIGALNIAASAGFLSEVKALQNGDFDFKVYGAGAGITNSDVNVIGAANIAPLVVDDPMDEARGFSMKADQDYKERFPNSEFTFKVRDPDDNRTMIEGSQVNAIGSLNYVPVVDGPPSNPSEGGHALSAWSNEFTVWVDDVKNSTVNGIGAMNLATNRDVDSISAVRMLAEQEDDFLFESDSVKDNSTVNAIGAMNLVSVDRWGSISSMEARQQGTFEVNTSRDESGPKGVHGGSTVNAIAAMNLNNLASVSTGTLSAVQSGTYSMIAGPITGGSTVNAVGALNITPASGTIGTGAGSSLASQSPVSP